MYLRGLIYGSETEGVVFCLQLDAPAELAASLVVSGPISPCLGCRLVMRKPMIV
jgi:hypothetical protein